MNYKKEIELTEKELEFTENDNLVKTYKALQEKLRKLRDLERESYKNELIHKYDTCKHITVYDKKAPGFRAYQKCIKCGLDSKLLYTKKYEMTEEQRIAYDYLTNMFFNRYNFYYPNGSFEEEAAYDNLVALVFNKNTVCFKNTTYEELLTKYKELYPLFKDEELMMELSKSLKGKTLKKEKN